MAQNAIRRGLVLLVVLAMFSSEAISAETEIARGEAKNLVKTWLAAQGYDTRSSRFVLESDPDRTDFSGFFFFSANYQQEQSAPSLGHFAVNRKTADLWDWELCRRLQTPAVQSVQKSLRKRLGLTPQDYSDLSKMAPCSGPT